MRLTRRTQTLVLITIVLFISSSLYSYANEIEVKNKDKDRYTLLFSDKIYEKESNTHGVDSILMFKELALFYAKKNKAELACEYLEKYIKSSLDVAFIGHSYFDSINSSSSYVKLADKYHKKLDFWWILCLYVGFVGMFISIVLNFRKRSDKIANLLMSAFLFQHSVFIINISLLPTNYEFYLPHSLYLSTLFSFLYGPLIYFYFKRVILKYRFVWLDVLHLVPTVLLLFLLLPVYSLPVEEKLRIMLDDKRPYITLISDVKLISLLVYMILVIRMYVKLVVGNSLISRVQHNWQRNIVVLCSIHIVSYVVYNILMIRRVIDGFPVHFQIISIALLILYISYMAFVYPSIFGGGLRMIKEEVQKELDKYRKSGLTETLSIELKEKLLFLLNQEKVYMKNDINLQKLAELLNTTRHNTSQVINEHFNLNFFELINRYRIEEAKKLLKSEKDKKVNIIDVAYEVGFNNKVTFNKSFKKYNRITPSEYVKS
ncbi:AraC family transcriptional regulator [Aquimarina algiphila]|uniref:AraC family transcriptional regulator n=1 Tax=Aquimarina algiphila TaxID=2047982 RepID=UPI00232A9651|nr:helix-turn-helix domain-containing protein [Aquimarina algiphila]